MILLIAVEESINWLIKAISHYIIEFWFITISTLQGCPRERSRLSALCNKQKEQSLFKQHKASQEPGKGSNGWVGLPLIVCGNKQGDDIQLV